MSWRDDLGRVEFSTGGGPPKRAIGATFRGVPFYVSVAERTGGRKTVVHEYPFRDEPFAEDQGRRKRGFPVEGYVIGDDYLFDRDALITELEAPGVGELVHPYYGTRRVIAESFRVRESSGEGGWAQFSIEFTETPAQPAQPTAVPDATGAALASITAARAAVQTEFLATYDPGIYTEGLAAALRAAGLAVESALAQVAQETQPAALMKARLDAIQDTAGSLVAVALDVYGALSEVLNALPSGTDSVYDFDPGERPPAEPASRVQEQASYDALQRLVQRLVAVRMAEVALSTTFESFEAAVTKRDTITDMLDEQLESASDDAYPVLMQLRADLVKAVPGTDSDLPHLVTYTPPITLPSLVLAHQLYGDATRETELVERNAVKNPGFVPGGQSLEVLSDG